METRCVFLNYVFSRSKDSMGMGFTSVEEKNGEEVISTSISTRWLVYRRKHNLKRTFQYLNKSWVLNTHQRTLKNHRPISPFLWKHIRFNPQTIFSPSCLVTEGQSLKCLLKTCINTQSVLALLNWNNVFLLSFRAVCGALMEALCVTLAGSTNLHFNRLCPRNKLQWMTTRESWGMGRNLFQRANQKMGKLTFWTEFGKLWGHSVEHHKG